MSRHRNIRAMNYEDEYDGYDDVYGQSVEDDYGVSPSTAAMFTYDRDRSNQLCSYMGSEEIVEEVEEVAREGVGLQDSLQETTASNVSPPQLSDIDQARLNSVLDELRGIVGDTCSEQEMTQAAVAADFKLDVALNALLSPEDAPKPQREEKGRKYKGSRGSSQSSAPTTESPATPASAVQPTVTVSAATPSTESADAEDTSPALARLTFNSGSKTVSGFPAEEKAVAVAADDPFMGSSGAAMRQQEQVEKARLQQRALEVTPRRVASSNELVRKGFAEGRDASPLSGMPRNASAADLTKSEVKLSKNRLDQAGILREYEKRKQECKECINLVVIGHVDAGKSTLMGHVLFQLGFVNKRTMHKYEQEARKLGKASFAYAWVLDETEEERTRGVTIDVAQSHFETASKLVRLLDAPGHKDFIPNMITGAAQADAAVLVVNATRGEFETGFEDGGQTREHAMLSRSLGVAQLVVAVNKMDTVEWAKTRYDQIVRELTKFLSKQLGFKANEVVFIPVSGLLGDNLVTPSTNPDLASWYSGPTLVQQIDKFEQPARAIDKPLRMCVTDVFKGMGAGISVAGMVHSGCVQPGDRLCSMPQAQLASVRAVTLDEEPTPVGFAGDNVVLTVTGIDTTGVTIGSILCDAANPIQSTSRIRANIVIFNIDLPITKGFPVVFHYQSLSEPAHIRKLLSETQKNSSTETVRKNPRCLTKNTQALVELELERPACLELFRDYKQLGRFMLRYSGHTIAAGMVTQLLASKSQRGEGRTGALDP